MKNFKKIIAGTLLLSMAMTPVIAFAVNQRSPEPVRVQNENNVEFRSTFTLDKYDRVKDGHIKLNLLNNGARLKNAQVIVNDGERVYKKIGQNSSDFYVETNNLDKIEIIGNVDIKDTKDQNLKINYNLEDLGLGSHTSTYANKRIKKDYKITNIVVPGEVNAFDHLKFRGEDGEAVTLELPEGVRWANSLDGDPTILSVKDAKVNRGTMSFVISGKEATVRPFVYVDNNFKDDVIKIRVEREDGTEIIEIGNRQIKTRDTERKFPDVNKLYVENMPNSKDGNRQIRLTVRDNVNLPRRLDFYADGALVKVNGFNVGTLNRGSDKFNTSFNWENSQDNPNNDVVLTLEFKNLKEDNVLTVKNGDQVFATMNLSVTDTAGTINTVSKDAVVNAEYIDLNTIVMSENKAGDFKAGTTYALSLPENVPMTFDKIGDMKADNLSIKNVRISEDQKTVLFDISKASKSKATITLSGTKVKVHADLEKQPYSIMFYKVLNTTEKDLIHQKRQVAIAGTNINMQELDQAECINVKDKVKETRNIVFKLGRKKYTVDGKDKYLDAAVFAQDDYTMLPLRAVGETLGLTVKWDSKKNIASIVGNDGSILYVTPNSKTLSRDSEVWNMSTKTTIKNDRLFLPISAIGEAFGLERDKDFWWDAEKREVVFDVEI